MSLLSSIQGTPERVWSLVRLLDAHKGVLGREAVLEWLSPAFVQNRQARPVSGELDGQAIGAATSLDLVRREGRDYVLTAPPPATYAAFADQTHMRLCGVAADNPDSVVLEAFAWTLIEVERQQSVGWARTSSQAFGDAVEHAIGGEDSSGERRFNSTKVVPWRRWIVMLGLGLELPGGLGFYPYVAERLLRELQASDLPRDKDLPAAQVLAEAALRMPYLDGGSMFLDLCGRFGLRLPTNRLTRLLSIALRDLNDEGALVMGLRGDAASDRLELTPDGQHLVQNFQTLRLSGAAR